MGRRPGAGSPAGPIGLLGFRAETEALVEPLTRLGVRTLGELARLGRQRSPTASGRRGCSRTGWPAARTSRCGRASREERLEETMDVGDASSGQALERVLGVLVDRLLARSERRGRTLRAVTLSARLLAGGGWRERVVFRQALSDRERISLALSLRLLLLPAPAAALGLTVERFGPPAGEQRALLDEGHAARMRAPARGRRPGARGGRRGRGDARRLRGPRLARARAAGRAHAAAGLMASAAQAS